MTKKDIAIIGGTFDPVHVGHVEMAKYLSDNYIVDDIWILPSYNSPHKNIDTISTFDDRVEMLKLATKNIDRVSINTFEKEYCDSNNNIKTYTYEVLEALKKKYLNTRFHFVVGFDSMKNIKEWHRYKELLRDYWFYIFDRDDKDYITLDKRKVYLDNIGKENNIHFIYEILNCNITNISSTDIRKLLLDVNNNKDIIIKYLDNNVLNYIMDKKLYDV